MNMKKTAKLSAISLAMMASYHVQADQVIQDDSIVVGSICVGLDCVNGESFGFDTIRLKENNVRIKATDTSSSSSFPTVDWQLTFNESINGGLNKFSIDEIDSGKTPFTIISGARNDSLFISSNGNIGMGTSTPLVNLEIKTGNTPSIRLSQDGSSGFSAQAWDLGGNESNFFIRDVTNGSNLPFRITPSAPNSSIYVAADGDVGFRTATPDGQLDIAHATNANNHALLIDPSSNVGVNIDNGFLPNGIFDVQTTGGVSILTVNSGGNVGIGTNSPLSPVHVLANTASRFDATLTVEDSDTASSLGQKQIALKNNGPSWLSFENTTSQDDWILANDSAGDFIYTKYDNASNSYTVPLRLSSTGTLTILGDLEANGTTYTSSKKQKENFSTVNPAALLEKVAQLDVSSWNYIRDNDSVKHIGPMAEQFHALFNLNGDKDDKISVSDISGVSIAAIKALIQQIDAQQSELDNLKKQINNL